MQIFSAGFSWVLVVFVDDELKLANQNDVKLTKNCQNSPKLNLNGFSKSFG